MTHRHRDKLRIHSRPFKNHQTPSVCLLLFSAEVAAAFNESAFETFLAERNEPAWLTERRRAGHARLRGVAGGRVATMKSGLGPTFAGSNSTASPRPAMRRAFRRRPPYSRKGVDLAGRVVSIDSRGVVSECEEQLKSQGVYFGSLTAGLQDPAVAAAIERQLLQAAFDVDYDRFSALHTAFTSGGALLYVPRGVRVTRPLHMQSVLTEGRGRFRPYLGRTGGRRRGDAPRREHRRQRRRRGPALRRSRVDRRGRCVAALRQSAKLGRQDVALRPSKGRRRPRRTAAMDDRRPRGRGSPRSINT